MLDKVCEILFPKYKDKIINRYLKLKYKIITLKYLFVSNFDICLVGTPEYGNLGDHAIAMAENKMFRDLKKKYIEITSPNIVYNVKGIKKIAKDKEIIITGGGFLGNIWMNEENMVRQVVTNFPNNKIIIFPQTVYYEETPEGQKEKNKTFELYRNHKNLHIYAREERTYKMLKTELKEVDIKLTPDIVMYLNMTDKKIKRENKITVCMRKDKEKTENKLIDELLKSMSNEKINYTDTVVNYKVTQKNRNKELMKKFKEFQESKLVITDRLHGMIFSAITSTPCICLDNLTKKVSGVYRWIKNLTYIKMIDDTTSKEEIVEFINEVENKEFNYEEKILLPNFKKICKEL